MTSSQWSFPRDLARLAVLRLKKLPPPPPILPGFLPLGTFSLSDWFCANAICSALSSWQRKKQLQCCDGNGRNYYNVVMATEETITMSSWQRKKLLQCRHGNGRNNYNVVMATEETITMSSWQRKKQLQCRHGYGRNYYNVVMATEETITMSSWQRKKQLQCCHGNGRNNYKTSTDVVMRTSKVLQETVLSEANFQNFY